MTLENALKDALIRLKNYEKTPTPSPTPDKTPSPDKSPETTPNPQSTLESNTQTTQGKDSPSLAEGDKGGGYQNIPATPKDTPTPKDTLTQNQNPNEPTMPNPKYEPSLFDSEPSKANTPPKDTLEKSTPTSNDLAAQNQNNTKTSNFSEIYKKREAIKHEINELKESYFSPQATTNYEPQRKAKIELLSDKKRQKIEWQMHELSEQEKQLKREIYSSHKILKDLHAQGKSEEILDALSQSLQNPNFCENAIKYKYANYPKDSTGKIILDLPHAQEYYHLASLESKNNTLLRIARKNIESNYDIHPAKDFGTNYAEFYKDGAGGYTQTFSRSERSTKSRRGF